jgi:outer membrane murein-binding lipoprotein Lpp
MPSVALLEAVNRLDQAVTTLESRIDALEKTPPAADERRQAAVRAALAELDKLIAGVKKPGAESEPAHG